MDVLACLLGDHASSAPWVYMHEVIVLTYMYTDAIGTIYSCATLYNYVTRQEGIAKDTSIVTTW